MDEATGGDVMTREEREMDIWQRAYENVHYPVDDGGRKRSADSALAAFREAFPNDPPSCPVLATQPVTPDGRDWAGECAHAWQRMSPGARYAFLDGIGAKYHP